MPPRRCAWCEQKQKLLVNVQYRTDIMSFVFLSIRLLPRLLQPVTQPRRTITVRSEIIAAMVMELRVFWDFKFMVLCIIKNVF
jgi:hypothetical protein